MHFLWAMPLAIAGGLFFFLLAMLNVIDVTGSRELSREDVALTVVFVIVGMLVLTSPIGLIPWTRNRAVRATTMLVTALALGGIFWLSILH